MGKYTLTNINLDGEIYIDQHKFWMVDILLSFKPRQPTGKSRSEVFSACKHAQKYELLMPPAFNCRKPSQDTFK